jgi:hypothetical protein
VSVDLKSRTVFVGVQPSTTFPAPLVALHNLTNVGNGMGPAVVVTDHGLVCILTTMSYLVCYDIASGTGRGKCASNADGAIIEHRGIRIALRLRRAGCRSVLRWKRV